MGLLLAFSMLGVAGVAGASLEPLPSRPLDLPPAIVQNVEPASFDLIDYRLEQQAPTRPKGDAPAHSLFEIKHHIGLAAGYDYGVVHSALGLYMTVAEWGRWNFGVPSPELGFGRYPAYDARHNRSFLKAEPALFISIASVHYRIAYIPSLGVNWYINLEQIFDVRENAAGSQLGLSFSRK